MAGYNQSVELETDAIQLISKEDDDKGVLGLVWPRDKDRVDAPVKEHLARPNVCYRSITSAKRNNIRLDINGTPELIGDMIASQAFLDGGWRKVQEITEPECNLGGLVAVSDTDDVESPFIWTSLYLSYATRFKDPEAVGRFLLVLNPDRQRVHLRDFSTIPEEEDEIWEQFSDVVEDRKLFIVDDINPDSLIHGDTDKPLETLF